MQQTEFMVILILVIAPIIILMTTLAYSYVSDNTSDATQATEVISHNFLGNYANALETNVIARQYSEQVAVPVTQQVMNPYSTRAPITFAPAEI